MNTSAYTPKPSTTSLQLPEETEFLIKASIAENTLKAYQRALQNLTVWLSGRTLSDALLANYITILHEDGKSPATIGQLKHRQRNQQQLMIITTTRNSQRTRDELITFPEGLYNIDLHFNINVQGAQESRTLEVQLRQLMSDTDDIIVDFATGQGGSSSDSGHVTVDFRWDYWRPDPAAKYYFAIVAENEATTKPTGAPDNSPASSKSYRSHKGG